MVIKSNLYHTAINRKASLYKPFPYNTKLQPKIVTKLFFQPEQHFRQPADADTDQLDFASRRDLDLPAAEARKPRDTEARAHVRAVQLEAPASEPREGEHRVEEAVGQVVRLPAAAGSATTTSASAATTTTSAAATTTASRPQAPTVEPASALDHPAVRRRRRHRFQAWPRL